MSNNSVNNSDGAKAATSNVQSVDRAISILEMLAHDGESGVTKIADELGVHKSTAFRLIATLEQRGLVEQDLERGKYRLGVGILRLAGATTARLDVVQETRPLARALAADDGGDRQHRGAFRRGCAVPRPDRRHLVPAAHNWVGQRIPLHATANGKVLLSGLTSEQIATEVGQRLRAYTPTTITSIKKLLVDIDAVREAGYAVVVDELEMGLTAIAAPLHNAHGDVIASLSVSGPTFRFDEDRVKKAVDQVMEVAIEVSERLGWRVPKRPSGEIDS